MNRSNYHAYTPIALHEHRTPTPPTDEERVAVGDTRVQARPEAMQLACKRDGTSKWAA